MHADSADLHGSNHETAENAGIVEARSLHLLSAASAVKAPDPWKSV